MMTSRSFAGLVWAVTPSSSNECSLRAAHIHTEELALHAGTGRARLNRPGTDASVTHR